MEQTLIDKKDIRVSDISAWSIASVSNCADSKVYLMDCIAGMKQYPDKFFDLAVVDPPYGMEGNKYCTVNKKFVKKGFAVAEIDSGGITGFSLGNRPSKEYFDELFRVSKNYIIWGGQYFSDIIPPNQCCLIWDKKMGEGVRFSDAEIALTSFKTRVSIFRKHSINCNSEIGGRIHPTEKPVSLYDWIFKNYATEGMKILDTHLGSGSSRISANKAGLNFVGFEIDNEYFDKSEDRFKKFVSQMRLF